MNIFFEKFNLKKHFIFIKNKENNRNLKNILNFLEKYFIENPVLIYYKKPIYIKWLTVFNLFYINNLLLFDSYLFFYCDIENASKILINLQNNEDIKNFWKSIFINRFQIKKIIIFNSVDKKNIKRLFSVIKIFDSNINIKESILIKFN